MYRVAIAYLSKVNDMNDQMLTLCNRLSIDEKKL